ncbi:MAG: DUF484 family protein [Rubricella sp.]
MHELAEDLRSLILDHPEIVLDDPAVMERLLSAQARPGANVVDLRGVLLGRLETRLDQLQETHRTVIAAAYENIAGTNAIHRAVLALLDPQDFKGLMDVLHLDLGTILQVDDVRLCIEIDGEAAVRLKTLPAIITLPTGRIARYAEDSEGTARKVLLRELYADRESLFDDPAIRSEALLRLDLGQGRRAAMLLLGSREAARLAPDQGTDLLEFLARVFERVLRRWVG